MGSGGLARTRQPCRTGCQPNNAKKMSTFPIFIISRDRLTPLRSLVEWLERAGHERIIIIDNDSTYPPLRDWYEGISHQIIYLGENVGCNAFWTRDVRAM